MMRNIKDGYIELMRVRLASFTLWGIVLALPLLLLGHYMEGTHVLDVHGHVVGMIGGYIMFTAWLTAISNVMLGIYSVMKEDQEVDE